MVIDPNISSDATATFENIPEQIQTSNLNFHLQRSPFSAVISLKKTLIKDKLGVSLLPSSSNPELLQKINFDNQALRKKINNLTEDYEDAVNDSENAHKTIATLKDQLEATKLEIIATQNIKKETPAEDAIQETEEVQSLLAENQLLRSGIMRYV